LVISYWFSVIKYPIVWKIFEKEQIMVNVERVVEEVWPELEKFMSVQLYGSFVNLTVPKHIPGWTDYEFRDKILLILDLKKHFVQLGYKVETDLNRTKLEVANCAAVASNMNGAQELWKRHVSELFAYTYAQATMLQHQKETKFSVDVYSVMVNWKYPVGYSEVQLREEVLALLQQTRKWKSVVLDPTSARDFTSRTYSFER